MQNRHFLHTHSYVNSVDLWIAQPWCFGRAELSLLASCRREGSSWWPLPSRRLSVEVYKGGCLPGLQTPDSSIIGLGCLIFAIKQGSVCPFPIDHDLHGQALLVFDHMRITICHSALSEPHAGPLNFA